MRRTSCRTRYRTRRRTRCRTTRRTRLRMGQQTRRGTDRTRRRSQGSRPLTGAGGTCFITVPNRVCCGDQQCDTAPSEPPAPQLQGDLVQYTAPIRPRTGRVRIAVVALATASASLAVAYSGAPPAAAASAACPWVGSSAPIPQRVSQLLSKMSAAQEVTLLTGTTGSSYVGFTPAIGSLCLPALNPQGGPAGGGG